MLVIENCNSLSDLRQKFIDGEEVRTVRQEPCKDVIRREDALQALCKAVHKNDDTIPCPNQRVSCLWSKTKVQDYAEEIWKLPSVNSQPKTRHWINIDATHSKCDRCEAVFEIVSENGEVNYCPNCGAKMVEPQESEE